MGSFFSHVLKLGLICLTFSVHSKVLTPAKSSSANNRILKNEETSVLTNNIDAFLNPNPTNGLLTITSKTELQKIEVMSVDGKILLSEIPTNISHTLHLDDFANGIYFVNLYQNNRVVMREKVILNK